MLRQFLHIYKYTVMYQTQQNFILYIIVLLYLTDTSLYIYICVKHFGMANIKQIPTVWYSHQHWRKQIIGK